MRFLIILLFPIISFGQFSNSEINRYKAQARQVTIIRDNWGIPHIYGKTDADAVFGLMYAQCEENLEQVEENALEMLGRMGEKFGKSYLYLDLQMQLIYDTAAAIRDYKRSPAWFRKLLDASADGINFYLFKHPEQKTAVLKRFEPWFALLRTDGSISATQTGGLTISDMRNLYPNEEGISFSENKFPVYDHEPTGSNGFALSPAKTVTGNAMLYINPHVSFYFRTEVQMVSEEGLNVYGAVTWGNFFVYQGFNEYCGWMHTSSYADVADLFIEKIENKNGSFFYQLDGNWIPVKEKKISIRILQDNKNKEIPFTTFSTGHGPVMGLRNGNWLSLKENNRSLNALMQSWLRTKAKGFTDFKHIMNLRSNNSNNTVFADSKGNIAYWHGNFMPKRNTKFDYSIPVDGSISQTDWKGLHKLDEIVHVYNPSSGWIQNCNSTPFTSAGNSSPKKENYPAYMAPDGQNFRAINAIRLLEGKKKFTFDQLIKEIGYSHYLAAFEILLPPLIKAWDSLEHADSMKEKLREAILELKKWDLNASENSIATTLAIEWATKMQPKASVATNPYQQSDVTAQIQSMTRNTSSNEQLQIFASTLDELEQRFGNWKQPWGSVNRYQRKVNDTFSDRDSSLPVGLAAGTWGSIPSFAARRFPQTSKRYGNSGNSFIACVEFGKKIKAKTIITGGQSFDPASNHYIDQAKDYIQGNLKEINFYKQDVIRHAEKQYHPGE